MRRQAKASGRKARGFRPKGRALDQAAITRAILDMFDGIHVDTSTGALLFSVEQERVLPFLSLKSHDDPYDQASGLNREGVYRFTLALSREAYESLFDPQAGPPSFDPMALDQVMPHPVYAQMHWICVLSPSEATFQVLQPMMLDAYALAVEIGRAHV